MCAPWHTCTLVCLSLQNYLRKKSRGKRLSLVLQNKTSFGGVTNLPSFHMLWTKLFIALIAASVKMSGTLFEGFDKIKKKQNKEQVPPPAETQQKKVNTAKQPKKSQSANSSKPTQYKTLEEAVKAVSICYSTYWYQHAGVLFTSCFTIPTCGKNIYTMYFVCPHCMSHRCEWWCISPFSFSDGFGGVKATAGEKSNDVPWESMCLGEGSGWVS